LSFEIFYLSIAVAVVVGVVNIVVYRRDSKKGLPLGKDLLRMFIVPAMFLTFWGISGAVSLPIALLIGVIVYQKTAKPAKDE
jgi:hypothetical protein